MKFGQLLEKESVPEWSLHNIDYNTLKQYIKAHTTRDQATAIPIPGQQDTALERFEDDFYDELCRQHDRVGLFVVTKTSEISQRLQYLSDQIHRLLLRGTTSAQSAASAKRQRRFAKYDRTAVQLRREIRDLSRFVNAQVVAFRKILKKYRKWTGSSSLGIRFRENILSDPKSFTRRDFSHLENQADELISIIRASTPASSAPQSPPSEPVSPPRQGDRRGSAQAYSTSSSTLRALSSSAGSSEQLARTHESERRTTLLASAPVQTHYWNEYDDGSEAGDGGASASGGYAIYLHPDEESEFPGMATLVSFFTVPIAKARKWMAARGADASENGFAPRGEHAPLLSQNGGYGTNGDLMADGGESGYLPHDRPRRSTFSYRQQQRHRQRRREESSGADDVTDHDGDYECTDGDTDGNGHMSSEEEDGDDVFGSDTEFPQGYEAHYASLPSINDQRIARYRELMLTVGAVGCFVAAILLLSVAGILISTGRHRLRIEVDAGVTMGVVASLGFNCAALGMIISKNDHIAIVYRALVWVAFAAICVLNGVVLVLVMGNTVV